MIEVLQVNPGKKTAVLGINPPDGGERRVVQKARFRKFHLRANGVQDAIFVGPCRGCKVVVITGKGPNAKRVERWEELPQTLVVPKAAIDDALARAKFGA